MSIRLVGWYGHGNLGDDAMRQFAEERFGHLGIVDEGYDWTIMCGGTQIMPYGEFLDAIDDPEHTVTLGIGVADSWEGQGADVLRRMARVYVRDFYSLERLRRFDIAAEFSGDPWLWFVAPKSELRTGVFANTMRLSNEFRPYIHSQTERFMERARAEGAKLFAMSPGEEPAMMGQEVEVFTGARELLVELATAKRSYTTRLHATVAAWIAGVPDRRVLVYDQKVQHFLDTANMFEDAAGLRPKLLRASDDIEKLISL